MSNILSPLWKRVVFIVWSTFKVERVSLIVAVLELYYSTLGFTKLPSIYWSLTKLHDPVLLGYQQESAPGRTNHSWEQLRLISLWLRKSKWKGTSLGGIRSCVSKHFWVECKSQRNVGLRKNVSFKYLEVFLRLFNVYITIMCRLYWIFARKS